MVEILANSMVCWLEWTAEEYMKKRNLYLKLGAGLLVLVLLVALTLWWIGNRVVPADDPEEGESGAFPRMDGTNLLLESVTVPDDLSGEYQLIVIAYDTDQQIYVDKWLRPLEDLNEDYPQMTGYYLPLLPQDTRDAAVAILGGMTLAAKSDEDRERTVVIFTDVDAFNSLTDVPDKEEVQLFLLDSSGVVRWHGSGAYQPETLDSLKAVLADLTA
jgi:hypothetical protein